jgi:hypothetical protein
MMFRLKLPTDPRWANIAEQKIEDILTDHIFILKRGFQFGQ